MQYRFDPHENITVRELAAVLACLTVVVEDKLYDKMPDFVQKHFVSLVEVAK